MKTENPSVAIIIPSRLGSSRFPRKPMASILGIPMVQRVHENAKLVPDIQAVAVATCDDEICEFITRSGGIGIMTSDLHERATDRTAEALLALESRSETTYDVVLMLQGDEPTILPEQIDQVAQTMLADSTIKVANLLGPITSEREFTDPNCIKVVTDLDGNALYFSRHALPFGTAFDDATVGKQVCVIGFQRDYLMKYLTLEPTPLEVRESVDMLRVLQHGGKVRMIRTQHPNQSVDVPEDIQTAEALLRDVGPNA